MKRRVLVIGIGAGDPDHVTVQAVKAMNGVDVFFIPDKGSEKGDLARVRHEIIERHVSNPRCRSVGYAIPARRRSGAYREDVAAWHAEIAAAYLKLLRDELDETQTGAFLVWGDPSLYDSVLRILDRVSALDEIELDYEVVPGITSVQVLAARHRVTLNNIGRSVAVSNGRAVMDEFSPLVDSVVVMLNADKALREADGDLQAYWGAYLGMPDEILVSGRLREILGDIERLRAEARERKGWIMDTVLLKRPEAAGDD